MAGSHSIRPMCADDWARVAAIYAAGIATGHATFADTVPSWDDWDRTHLTEHRFVACARDSDQVLGWTAVSATSDRCAYAGVVELSVYVDPVAQGSGVGARLLSALISSTEAAGIRTIQSGIFPENAGSLALHAAHDFEVLGTRRRIGLMTHGPLAGTWRDVMILERRSLVAGT